VHCPRHRSVLSFADEDFADANVDRIHCLASAEETLQQVCVRDVFSQLFRLLEPLDKRILVLLSQGHQVCEIARHLKISHSTVTKRRTRIAETAVSIGFSPEVGLEPPIRVTKL
jgi:DNA-binding NarL/FixJ family response regulator